MEKGTPLKCKKCRKEVSFNELTRENDIWMCFDCYEKMHLFPTIKETSMKQLHDLPPPNQVVQTNISSIKIYLCYNCGYKMERDNFDTLKLCPYCGEKGTINR